MHVHATHHRHLQEGDLTDPSFLCAGTTPGFDLLTQLTLILEPLRMGCCIVAYWLLYTGYTRGGKSYLLALEKVHLQSCACACMWSTTWTCACTCAPGECCVVAHTLTQRRTATLGGGESGEQVGGGSRTGGGMRTGARE